LTYLSDTILEIIVVIPSKGIEPILKKSLYSPPSIPMASEIASLKGKRVQNYKYRIISG
jgi:hypothetical protein